ncbi:hypothetical protein EV646_103271 [Kribbella antiqua]|uniref:Uncharacterized protein n=1 Tax=Kribbella antiqua TaxID=2512217 RepID=A0A4R2IUQ6_9ACTN|nr:hypothetical protein [Kribbella antiqua]TCO49293.1 hypothetical protein EV646_103271 [Kribbella antiqua]
MTTTPIPSTPAPAPARRTWNGWRTLLVIAGALFALCGMILLAIGGIGLWAHQQRDGDGYFSAGPERVSTTTFAVSVPSLDVDGTGPDAVYAHDLLGDVRIQLKSMNAGVPVFIGIGPADQVATYLADIGHQEVTDLDVDPFKLTTTRRSGGRPAALPATQSFWVASDAGDGSRTLNWKATEGDWAVVVMNADGSPGVDVDLSVGATLPAIRAISIGALIGSGVLLTIGTAMIVAAFATRRSAPGRRRGDQEADWR